jgi:hypothetical protein
LSQKISATAENSVAILDAVFQLQVRTEQNPAINLQSGQRVAMKKFPWPLTSLSKLFRT